MAKEFSTKVNGRAVTLRFERDEHEGRIARARAAMRAKGLSALLVFAQESHFYLTGYDTSGYVFFQCGVLTAEDGPKILLTRRPDQSQAEDTSLYDDIRIWLNAENVNPADELRKILEELGLKGERVGIELATYGLTGYNYERVRVAMDGFCTLVDASEIVRELRVRKSPAELEYVRRAGQLADDAVWAMVEAARPGISDSLVTSACIHAMLAGGGDMPSGDPMVNSGPRAVYGRGLGVPRMLEAQDQIMLEHAASFCRYTVVTERTVVLGKVPDRQRTMFKVATDTLYEIIDYARPGHLIGELDDIHRRNLDAAGYEKYRFSACGYSLGTTFRPTWMDPPPMLYSGNRTPIETGMVLFCHVVIGDRDHGLTAATGLTFHVGEKGTEILSEIPMELHVK
ncbi:Xaa-Pro peptidase family protein [Mesorhizobium sp. INR15]|uniref:M24 family metallopeptidase n=1 Tax=Mesorhizobium sp. INR15 TaxID=2654248 RepID=UPI0018966E25|nr:Xaa-Pro peptidase family protein [Mesorhizobium sp. INR15]